MSGMYVFQGDAGDPHALAQRLAAQMAHGGEPVKEHVVADGTVLGCVSLDTFQHGRMPRFLDREGIWGMLEGELYDSPLRRAYGADTPDLDVFARLFASGRLFDELPRMNGAFFFVLWQPSTRTLVAGNDRFGLYPMYWAQNGGRFCLAGRVLCSVLSGAASGAWDPVGAAQFFATDDYVGETTLVRGVSSFPQATLLEKRDDRIEWRRYWRYAYTDEAANEDPRDLARELGARLVKAVERQSARPGRVGVTLSGGLDSRCLVAAASKAGVSVDTFTWAKAGAFDRAFAGRVAAAYGTRHHDCEYAFENFETRFDEGMRLGEGLINYFDCHMLAHTHILGEHADLILNGYAGDLILGGSYLRPAWMGPVPADKLAQRLFAWRNSLVPEGELGRVLADVGAVAADEMPSARFRSFVAEAEGPSTGDTVDRFVLENRVRRVTSMGTVIMRRSVESSAPFFDYDLVDLVLRVPPVFRAEHGIYKWMMEETFPEALRLPWQRTLLPAGAPGWAAIGAKGFLKAAGKAEKIFGWPKLASRLSPVSFGPWLRGPLRPWMERVIREPNPVADEIVRPEFCVAAWDEHLAGRDRTRLLGAIAGIRGFAEALRRAR